MLRTIEINGDRQKENKMADIKIISEGKYIFTVIVVSIAIGLISSCQTLKTATVDPKQYNPQIIPENFTINIDNPYYSLSPGTTFVYKSKTDDGIEINKVVVTDKTRKVMGVTCRVVWDRVWLNDKLNEETYDWYAQDKIGNVWYFGENSKKYKEGNVATAKGSWKAGVNGAMPGIVMKAKPQRDNTYYQEYYKGEAEDMAEIISLNKKVTVPYGSFTKCIKTRDFTPLNPDAVEYKYYSSVTGSVVLETEAKSKTRAELIDIIRRNEKEK